MHPHLPQIHKKHSTHKKSTHIHFDASTDHQPEHNEPSLIEQKLKRQQEIIQTEKHQKITKKPKIDQPSDYRSDHRPQRQSYGLKQDSQPMFGSLEQFAQKKEPKIKQTLQEVELKSLQLLKQLLSHPDIHQQALINPEVANNWILSPQTPTKIKSFLALYMILYQFDSIEFGFKRTIKIHGPEFKTIQIEKVEDKLIFSDQVIKKDDYQSFKKNEFKNYLAGYLEWLIWINQHTFDTSSEDIQFWAMALNNCEKTSMHLLRSTNQRQAAKNVHLASFLMNAQDFVFRSTSQLPRTKNIFYMNNEDLSLLPSCHWVLGLSFSVRYFYQKGLGERISSSLENVEPKEMNEFYHEYQLLSSYFLKRSQPFKGLALSDRILEWLAWNSESRQDLTDKKTQHMDVVSKICSCLLSQAVQNLKDTKHIQDKILLTVQLLERDIFLSQDEKDKLLSQILYERQKIAYKLGRQFPEAVNKLEHIRKSTLPSLSQRLTNEYTELYSHLILSEHPAIQNDLLTQLKHLTNISFQRQTQPIIQRIASISSSFNLLTHWNKDVLKTFVFILDKYLQSFNQFLQQQEVKKSKDKNRMEVQENQTQKLPHSRNEQKKSRNEQKKEFQTLCTFVKIHLNLEPLNTDKLREIINLIKSVQNSKSHLPFQLKTISFIKKNLLSILFAKNAFNQALLLQIKKTSTNKKVQNQQHQNASSSTKNQSFLEELKQMARGIKYFENQLELLTIEAKSLSIFS